MQGSLCLDGEQCSHLLSFLSAGILRQDGTATRDGVLSSLEVEHEPEEGEICLDPGMSLRSWPFAELLFIL